MPLENATTISQLDEQWPHGGDGVDRGDDHIRLIKHVLKSTFPGPSVNNQPGQGFSVPITVDPILLNDLAARLTSMENAIKNARPIGSIELRADNIDPATLFPGTTWTRIGGDFALAIGNGSNGGENSGSNEVSVPLPRHSHGITINGVGDHTHAGNVGLGGASFEHHQYNSRMPCESWSPNTSAAGAHTHTATIAAEGAQDAKINVRGARFFVNVWKRTA